MNRRKPSPFDEAVTRAARAAVQATDPDEMPLLDDLLDPPRHLFRWRRPDAVGFGVDDAVHWVSPYALAAALWFGRTVFDEGRSVVEERTRATVRNLLQRKKTDVPTAERATAGTRPVAAEHAEHVEQVRDYAISLGLDPQRAEILAEAVVGSILRTAARSDAGE
ncbi:hypothetical protein [Actinoplanes sp. RD1]|uniref:hypothetical protein n=1 Tax=Actinoplanes sp. RD1 TaxID=3064538 RepID=UPI002741779D|nr:hypothetical protein [Actinoplanes sp. RD1]